MSGKFISYGLTVVHSLSVSLSLSVSVSLSLSACRVHLSPSIRSIVFQTAFRTYVDVGEIYFLRPDSRAFSLSLSLYLSLSLCVSRPSLALYPLYRVPNRVSHVC